MINKTLYVFLLIITSLIINFVLTWSKKILYVIGNKFCTRKYKKKYKSCNLYRIDAMEGIEFEELLCVYFSNMGYESHVTKPTNDFGADLVLKKNHERTVVQAKRYKQKVGISAVQEVVAAKAYYKATNAMVVTNSFYTESAKELAKANHVKLLDRNDLIKLVEDYKNV